MTYLNKRKRNFVLGMLTVLAVIMSLYFAPAFAPSANADERGFRHEEFRDSHHGHDRFYPRRGVYITVLPPDHRMYDYGGSRFYFSGGVWYRGEGPRFIVVAPPFGLVIPYLPPYYTTVWVGPVPYYYANEVYYTPAPGGYVIVQPPQGTVSQAPPQGTVNQAPLPSEQLYIYPRNKQGEKQQATDRYECHRWAASQAGFDPTMPPAGMSGAQVSQKNADYHRAMAACLDGRGYTVK
jgi:hypothetical protein